MTTCEDTVTEEEVARAATCCVMGDGRSSVRLLVKQGGTGKLGCLL